MEGSGHTSLGTVYTTTGSGYSGLGALQGEVAHKMGFLLTWVLRDFQEGSVYSIVNVSVLTPTGLLRDEAPVLTFNLFPHLCFMGWLKAKAAVPFF